MKNYYRGIFIAGVALLIIAFFLGRVFSGRLILPQTIDAGFLHIHIYGIFIALAVIAAWLLAIKRSEQYGISREQIDNILLFVLIFGFLGARAYHVVSSYSYYWGHPLDIFKVWNGGLAIYGAVLGGVIGLWLSRKVYKLPANSYQLLDWLAPSVLLGQIIGRFGNFFNYELYGYPTALPWKMFVPENFRSMGVSAAQFFHPLFLYEALGNAIALFVLMAIAKKSKLKHPGVVFFSYLLLYNGLRFFLEFLRVDSTIWAGLRVNALVSLLLVLISGVYLRQITRHDNTGKAS
jgi:phosphatidylglycerol:prolipoprotein diacylglycerol transferase